MSETETIQDTLTEDNDNNGKEDALILAAEAADALMNNLLPDAANLDIANIPLALMDISTVGANEELAGAVSGDQGEGGTLGGAGDRVNKSLRARTWVNYAEGLIAEDVAAAGGEASSTSVATT